MNFVFATLYWLVPGSVANARLSSFADAFFFSIDIRFGMRYHDAVTTAADGTPVLDLTKIGALEQDVGDRREQGWTEREAWSSGIARITAVPAADGLGVGVGVLKPPKSQRCRSGVCMPSTGRRP